MIARMLSFFLPAAAPQDTGSLAWTCHSSAEMHAGRYAIIDDPNDPEVQVLVDGMAIVPGFGGLERSQGLVRTAPHGGCQ